MKKRKNLILLGGAIIIILLIALPISFLISGTEIIIIKNDNDYQSDIIANYQIYTPVIPDNLEFAGEKVPLDTYYVYEAVDRELLTNMYWHSNLIQMIKRTWRFFPIIEPILAEEGVPDDFKYLALIESSFTNAISPAGAAGFWQFMKATGQQFNLEVSGDVDERFHLEKATYAACKYLKNLNKMFGSWTLASAAYNMGQGALRRQMNAQKQDNYWDLHLNSETSRYVSRILALKLIIESPVNFGLRLRYSDLYQPIPTEKIAVDTSINSLVDFALLHNSNYRILKEFNPWLRSTSLANRSGKTYYIELPKEGYTSRAMQLSNLENQNAIYKLDTISN